MSDIDFAFLTQLIEYHPCKMEVPSLSLGEGSCGWCGTNIPLKRKFCSLSCGAKHQGACKAVPIKFCLQCKKCFDGRTNAGRRRKFCSQSCSARYNNHLRTKAKPLRAPCLHCSESIKKNSHTYCSFKCQQEYAYTKRVDNWLAGNDIGYSGVGQLRNFIRKWVLERAGHKCEICGWCEIHPITGRPPLDVDHIDGDWRNNRPDNLRALCPNHHALTPTYRALNMGNGREMRRK